MDLHLLELPYFAISLPCHRGKEVKQMEGEDNVEDLHPLCSIPCPPQHHPPSQKALLCTYCVFHEDLR